MLALEPTFMKRVAGPSLCTVRTSLVESAEAKVADVALEKVVLVTVDPCCGYVVTVPEMGRGLVDVT